MGAKIEKKKILKAKFFWELESASQPKTCEKKLYLGLYNKAVATKILQRIAVSQYLKFLWTFSVIHNTNFWTKPLNLPFASNPLYVARLLHASFDLTCISDETVSVNIWNLSILQIALLERIKKCNIKKRLKNDRSNCRLI